MASPGWLKTLLQMQLPKIERSIGMRVGTNVLGCGHWGCVLELDDPRWVLKLTRDPTEGPLVHKIMQLRAHDPFDFAGIVYYKSLFEGPSVRWRGKAQGTFVIVREAVRPWNWQTGDESNWALVRARDWAHQYFDNLDHHRAERLVDEARSSYIDACLHIGDMRHYEYVGDTMLRLADEDLILRDVHLNNVGFSTTNWSDQCPREPGAAVIHDLGHTPTDAPPGSIQPLSEFLAGLSE